MKGTVEYQKSCMASPILMAVLIYIASEPYHHYNYFALYDVCIALLSIPFAIYITFLYLVSLYTQKQPTSKKKIFSRFFKSLTTSHVRLVIKVCLLCSEISLGSVVMYLHRKI